MRRPERGASSGCAPYVVSALASALSSDGKRLGRIQVRGWRKTWPQSAVADDLAVFCFSSSCGMMNGVVANFVL